MISSLDDIFSSLDGMLFDWSLVSDADSADKNAANNVLRYLRNDFRFNSDFSHFTCELLSS